MNRSPASTRFRSARSSESCATSRIAASACSSPTTTCAKPWAFAIGRIFSTKAACSRRGLRTRCSPIPTYVAFTWAKPSVSSPCLGKVGQAQGSAEPRSPPTFRIRGRASLTSACPASGSNALRPSTPPNRVPIDHEAPPTSLARTTSGHDPATAAGDTPVAIVGDRTGGRTGNAVESNPLLDWTETATEITTPDDDTRRGQRDLDRRADRDEDPWGSTRRRAVVRARRPQRPDDDGTGRRTGRRERDPARPPAVAAAPEPRCRRATA